MQKGGQIFALALGVGSSPLLPPPNVVGVDTEGSNSGSSTTFCTRKGEGGVDRQFKYKIQKFNITISISKYSF